MCSSGSIYCTRGFHQLQTFSSAKFIKIISKHDCFCIKSKSRLTLLLPVSYYHNISWRSERRAKNLTFAQKYPHRLFPALNNTFLVTSKGNCAILSKHVSFQRTLFHQPRSFGEKLIQASPTCIQPYLKLTRISNPTGTLLLLWPCLWSISLSAEAGHWPSLSHLSLFTLGAFIMRGAGCTINDMWDKDIDAKVERTKLRPLAAGDIDSTDALGFLALQLGCASLILLQLNWYSILLGCCSMGLVVAYPLAKRYTNWPQLVLGFTFNWGALLGWASVHGACDWLTILPLYAAGISWTLIYDTIYAHQDRQEDSKLGIKSTALLFGGESKKWLTLFGSSMIANLLLTGVASGQAWPFFVSTGLVGLHLCAQIATLDINNPENCAKRFRSNGTLGIILFFGIVSGTLLKDKKDVSNSER